MCLARVKEYEEEYTVPARVTRVRSYRRRSPSPPRSVRYSRRSIVEERRPSPSPPPIIVPREPTVVAPSPRASTTVKSETKVSRAPSRAPSARTRSHYVEVDHDSDTSSSSSSSDVRSRTTSHTRKTSRSKTTAPVSEYSMHEKEYRRERDYRPRNDFETYRYVEAPPSNSGSRSRSRYDDPRASRDGPRRETNIVIDDNGARRNINYRR